MLKEVGYLPFWSNHIARSTLWCLLASMLLLRFEPQCMLAEVTVRTPHMPARKTEHATLNRSTAAVASNKGNIQSVAVASIIGAPLASANPTSALVRQWAVAWSQYTTELRCYSSHMHNLSVHVMTNWVNSSSWSRTLCHSPVTSLTSLPLSFR